MLKNILSAIGTALRGAVALVRGVLSIPGRLAGALLGGGGAPPTGDSPLVQDLARQVAKADAEAQHNYKRIADAIWHWCADSLIAAGPVAVPTWLPRSIKQWLAGLTPREAERLVSADKTAIQAHARGLYPLAGVRKVQRLEPATWAPEPIWNDPSPSFIKETRSVPELRALLRDA